MLGIIGAMDVEVAEVKEVMQDVEVKTMAGMDFYKGSGGPFRNRQGERGGVHTDSGGPLRSGCGHQHGNRRFFEK